MYRIEVITVCVTFICVAAAQPAPTTIAPDESSAADQKRIQHQRYVERRRETARIGHTYEDSFFKLAPTVYDKMMAAVQVCDKQMGMETDDLKKCVSRRMMRQPDKKKQDKKNAKKQRSKRQAAESTTTVVPIVSDEGTTEAVATTDPSAEKINSWRNVWAYEGTLVRCSVDGLRKTEFKDTPRKEWRDIRDQKVNEVMKQKAECMKKQLFP